LRQLSARLEAVVESLSAEVEISVRDVETAYREVHGRYEAMTAAILDVQYFQRRWELLPGDDRAASFLLEDLLDAQDRLALAEHAFVRAQVEYTVNLTRLNRATGILLKHEQIHLLRGDDGCLPVIRFEKPAPQSPPPLPGQPIPHDYPTGS
jgi:outer membrane protein TolC